MEIKNKRILDLEIAYRNKWASHELLKNQFKQFEVTTENLNAYIHYADYIGTFNFNIYEKPTNPNNLMNTQAIPLGGSVNQLKYLEEHIEILQKLKEKIEEKNNGK